VTPQLSSARRRLLERPELLPVFIGGLLLVVRSVLNFGSSLWIDETITAWVVRESLWEVVVRATEFQGQSPLYFLGPWVVTHVFGMHEWALRLPSLLCNLITVAALFGLFKVLGGKDVAGYGAGTFAVVAACTPQLQVARPYALAICCFSLSLLFFVRWALSAKRSMMVCFALSISGVLYSHYLFALGFPLVALLWGLLGKRSIVDLKDCGEATTVCAILALPAVWQLHLLRSKASLYSFSPQPSLDSWAHTISVEYSSMVVIALVAALLIARRIPAVQASSMQARLIVLAICVWVYPSLALLAISITTNCPVLVQRYSIYSIIGESLLQGLVLCLVVNVQTRRFIFLTASTVAVVVSPPKLFFGEDWRGALNDISRSATEPSIVLVWAGLTETKDQAWVLSPEKRAYLLSPLSMYPVAIPTSPLPLFPHLISPGSVFSENDHHVVEGAKRIFVVLRTTTPFTQKFAENNQLLKSAWLDPQGTLVKRSSKLYEGLCVIELERVDRGASTS
jgi:mannosyltransferase